MAFGIGLDMLGAILIVHLPHGFFMNWYGAQAGEGFEYHLLAIALSLVIIIGGSGKLSVDRLLHGLMRR
jgi:putative oxidoreductase